MKKAKTITKQIRKLSGLMSTKHLFYLLHSQLLHTCNLSITAPVPVKICILLFWLLFSRRWCSIFYCLLAGWITALHFLRQTLSLFPQLKLLPWQVCWEMHLLFPKQMWILGIGPYLFLPRCYSKTERGIGDIYGGLWFQTTHRKLDLVSFLYTGMQICFRNKA